MNEYIQILLPATFTVLCNIIFYLAIKKKVDNSIEKYKISYSGVFKEKIDIYKNLLSEVHDLKVKLNQFQYYENPTFKLEIQQDFNKLIRLYSVNKPFLSSTLISSLENVTKELQYIYESMVLGNIANYGKMPPEEVTRREKIYWDAINKLRSNKSLNEVEERIIDEIRTDLNTK